MLNPMDFEAVAFERTPLCETLLAKVAFIGSDSCVRPRMPLKVEGVVEAFAAESAEVSFHVAVALHVAVQQSLEAKVLAADAAGKPVGVVILEAKKL